MMPAMMHWAGGSAAVTAFAASLVEFIEALTVVLAVGAARGWRPALAGAAGGVGVLALLLAAVGPAIGLPSPALRLVVGVLSLLFGLRWLRKAILRAAGRLPLHDEQAAYDQARARLGSSRGAGSVRMDTGAIGAAFQVVLLEGIEVAFIVAATAAGGGRLMPAVLGAGAALGCVIVLGVALHRPMTRVPENTLKLAVGVLMAAFGLMSIGEGVGAPFPGGDLALPLLAGLWAVFALLLVRALSVRGAVASP